MKLLEELIVINIGLELFARELSNQQAKVVHVNWAPPAQGDDEILSILGRIG